MDSRGKNTRKDSLELGMSCMSSGNLTDTERTNPCPERKTWNMHVSKQVASSDMSYALVLYGCL